MNTRPLPLLNSPGDGYPPMFHPSTRPDPRVLELFMQGNPYPSHHRVPEYPANVQGISYPIWGNPNISHRGCVPGTTSIALQGVLCKISTR